MALSPSRTFLGGGHFDLLCWSSRWNGLRGSSGSLLMLEFALEHRWMGFCLILFLTTSFSFQSPHLHASVYTGFCRFSGSNHGSLRRFCCFFLLSDTNRAFLCSFCYFSCISDTNSAILCPFCGFSYILSSNQGILWPFCTQIWRFYSHFVVFPTFLSPPVLCRWRFCFRRAVIRTQIQRFCIRFVVPYVFASACPLSLAVLFSPSCDSDINRAYLCSFCSFSCVPATN